MLKMYVKYGALSYMVITITEELREKFKDPEELKKFREYLREMLQREGIVPVLYMWHFAGDKGKRWYPHINLVFPSGYMDKEKLKRLHKLIDERWGIKQVNLRYTRSLEKIRHWARYISRPTWNLQDEVKPDKWKRWKKWGVWKGELLEQDKENLTEQELERYWMALGSLVSSWLQLKKGVRIPYKDVRELINTVLEMVKKSLGGNGGDGLSRLLNVALRSREWSLHKRIELFLDEVLRLKGFNGVKELIPYIVSHGRCIGCFQKLKWKWRKSPFVSVDQKVFKVGWGVWVAVDKEQEEEEFPF
jgi:hypothetical protein